VKKFSKSSLGNQGSISDCFHCFFLPVLVLIFYILGWPKPSRTLSCQAIPLWLFLPVSQSLKVSMFLSNFSWVKIKLRDRWLTLVILVTRKAEIRRITIQSLTGQIICETPSSKLTRKKWNGGVGHVVEHLLCSNPCTTLSPKTKPKPNQTKT
jgi:hypothetical protein